VEDISNKYIKDNVAVYAADVPLNKAYEINGLRAVFGETYPDPVRVVSVGVPIEDLLADPKNTQWHEISVELCGGTHVNKTGEIKELVITEEAGIAKGIRRIVAVTGQAAYDVQKLAASFDTRLDALEAMAVGPEKEAETKSMGVELKKLSVSVLAKNALNEKYAKIQKKVSDEVKAKQKQESKKAVDAVTKHFTDNEGIEFAVLRIPDLGANSKAITEAIGHVKAKLKGKSVYLFAGDQEKVAHGAFIAEDHAEKGLVASDLGSIAAKHVGGRAGGKGPVVSGSGTEPSKIDAAVSEIEAIFKKSFGL
jgi:alanyl-tRNA synthetase